MTNQTRSHAPLCLKDSNSPKRRGPPVFLGGGAAFRAADELLERLLSEIDHIREKRQPLVQAVADLRFDALARALKPIAVGSRSNRSQILARA